jgi:hypothetical protein
MFRKLASKLPRVLSSIAVCTAVGLVHLSMPQLPCAAESKFRTTHTALDLKGGNPALRTIYLLHDSDVPTHMEYIRDLDFT